MISKEKSATQHTFFFLINSRASSKNYCQKTKNILKKDRKTL